MRLIQHAWSIPLEPRVRLIPQGRPGAIIYAGDETAVSVLLRDEPAGMASERREYLLSQVACRKATRLRSSSEAHPGPTRSAPVATVWMVRVGENHPRLVTAFPRGSDELPHF